MVTEIVAVRGGNFKHFKTSVGDSRNGTAGQSVSQMRIQMSLWPSG